jgi:monofunctional biosynthetic peptidoglycan transglycosylase
MEMYLNVAETGIGTYGVEAASQRYFGHGAAHLSSIEAAASPPPCPAPRNAPWSTPAGSRAAMATQLPSGAGCPAG